MFRLRSTFPLSASLLLALLAMSISAARLDVRQSSSTGYTDPTTNGGSLLTRINPSTELGEPLNVIISGDSDQNVLTNEGIAEYFESLFFSPGDCAGISAGDPQQANLGDGQGYVNQTNVLRFNYYAGDEGTCLESIKGGNHLRYWQQQSTKAIFIAASVEFPATQSHNIVPNGYDLGRDWITGNATANGTDTTTQSPGGFVYSTTASQASLLQSVQQSNINHGIGVDGTVDVLTVRIEKTGQLGANRTKSSSSSSSSDNSSSSADRLCPSAFLLCTFALLAFSL